MSISRGFKVEFFLRQISKRSDKHRRQLFITMIGITTVNPTIGNIYLFTAFNTTKNDFFFSSPRIRWMITLEKQTRERENVQRSWWQDLPYKQNSNRNFERRSHFHYFHLQHRDSMEQDNDNLIVNRYNIESMKLIWWSLRMRGIRRSSLPWKILSYAKEQWLWWSEYPSSMCFPECCKKKMVK